MKCVPSFKNAFLINIGNPLFYISLQTGFTALHVAAQHGQMDFVREMLVKVPATVKSEAPHSGDGAARELGPEVTW